MRYGSMSARVNWDLSQLRRCVASSHDYSHMVKSRKTHDPPIVPSYLITKTNTLGTKNGFDGNFDVFGQNYTPSK